jgi:cytoplasmic iron level regulating protein YaaA (DUF328/UPF0246 family)
MLIVISPAKTLDFDTPSITKESSIPKFLDDSQELIDTMKSFSPDDVGRLMKISQKLSELNVERYHDWHTPFTVENAKQAVLAFKGDVYTGLDAETLSDDDLNWGQSHLRILSGLYGTLRPLDLMQAYRLEMGIKLENPRGKNLYEFWGEKVTDSLNEQLGASGSKHLVNLASNEYFKSVKKKSINGAVITPDFKDFKNGKYKIISFYAKKARGLMTRWIIENRITSPDQLLKFDVADYRYSEEQSSENNPVFLREEQG